MANAPANVIDALNSLLEAELNSVFRFIEGGFPYLNKANAETRKTISELAAMSHRHCHQLAGVIDSLGGVVLPKHSVNEEGQYLAYLSLKFLLPKLVTEKEMILERYRNTRAVLKTEPAAAAAVDRIIAEKENYLDLLQRAVNVRRAS